MQINHRQRLILLWLLLSALLSAYLFTASQSALDAKVKDHVRRHLLLTMDESLFGTTQNRGNDQEGLQRIGEQVNIALQNLVVDRWFSAQRECAVRLQRVDDVIVDEHPMHRAIRFSVPMNQAEREIEIGLSCSRNWLTAAGVASVLGLFFIVIHHLLPPPLTRTHRQWINYLLERGYEPEQAFDIIRKYDAARLNLSATQLVCLERLHDTARGNFSQALDVATDARVAALNEHQINWLLLGLATDPTDLARALALAQAEDSVVIDLTKMTLNLRGLNVPMSGTPLFYYAWYAMSRINGPGWITNPATNRPDRVAGGQLVELMSRFGGHAKAINDLEQTGLKARTLDQNRSKIKDDIVAVLGERLSTAYLFEASKHPDGIHMQYRLSSAAHRIRIIT
ncbi:MAG: hypothetical protein R3E64_02210 [Halioglobus sp.]